MHRARARRRAGALRDPIWRKTGESIRFICPIPHAKLARGPWMRGWEEVGRFG
jgi:hypothetical protein